MSDRLRQVRQTPSAASSKRSRDEWRVTKNNTSGAGSLVLFVNGFGGRGFGLFFGGVGFAWLRAADGSSNWLT
ncbi:hypothetical protein, partial [Mesorhizobium sp. B2-7-1]|uniref:hypothetical protein n=1 Tax=Mesorhizobium sp. B2-7-1 TaxID=2589909 RepID=UPI001AEE99D4